jgi:hypothetical protein
MAMLPSGELPFLQQREWQNNSEWAGLDDSVDQALQLVASRVASSPALRALAWHQVRQAFDLLDFSDFARWPVLDQVFPEGNGAYYLLLALNAVERVRAIHAEREVPEAVTRATCADIGIMMRRYAAISGGKIGVEHRNFSWYRVIASGDLHRVGRFEYILRPFRGPLRAYRKRASRQVVALCEEGSTFDQNGYQSKGVQENSWTAHLEETDASIRGQKMSPCGYATREKVTLSRTEWECVLRPGDRVLEIHIPEDGAMTPQSCFDSLREAAEFFPRYYPQLPFRSFACYSWILNTQFQEMLGQHSNLVAFQRELYLFPIPSSGKDGLYFIFYHDDIDPMTAPRDTALRRAVIEYLENGRPLRNGGMFFLPEDLSRYGTQGYQSCEFIDIDKVQPGESDAKS